ncbi:sugar transferase [Psychroflexus sp. CAK57W]|uniref:sugar transferase n=1 Tax=Psychroflexus curvus TaxID=2873595 RepID=UPI001CC91322|nr:sugar transferase [Psychroflexus curvus]MBZ9786721.1 sugar transferase [Psychroflexus curvus]
MTRLFDFLFSFFGLLLLSPILFVLIIIGFFDTGKPLFIQPRVGQHKKTFKLIKFRTMHPNTKSVATHLASQSSITKFGSFLRKSKLDELPQLINVFKGDMSLVGPRPNLYNQEELIEERDKRKVYAVLPGITGLSQINEIDMSTPKELAISDQKMIETYSLMTYFYYIFATVSGKGKGDRIKT